jgi:Zn-dependent protease with chaperone function
MHTFFLLSALLLAALISMLGAALLRLLPVGNRRPAALVVLGLPPAVLGLATTHLIPLFWAECAPLIGWDRVASFSLLGIMGAAGLSALGLSSARLALVDRLLPACMPVADSVLTADVLALAQGVGLSPPALRVLPSRSPLAVAGGLRRPSVVLSSWLLEHLDRHELESVVSHELAHLARRDYLTRWLARLLRDATVYLPGAWYALRVLEADEELSADALAVSATGRPLAMASALGKVWRALSTAESAGLAGAPAYAAGSAALIEERLQRLMSGQARPTSGLLGRLVAGIGLLGMGELAAQVLALSATTIPFVCTMRLT